jgi:hypothetical protein
MNANHPVSRLETATTLAIVTLVLSLALPISQADANDAPPLPPLGEVLDAASLDAAARKFDWVQLKNGEWLKGEITRVQDNTLEFDSDEFDDVILDWDDVASLIPKGVSTCRFPDQVIVTGRMFMRNGKIRIEGADGVYEADRADLITLINGEQTELSYWSGSASLGASSRSGNTDQSDITARANLTRESPRTRTKADYTGEFSTADGDTTANSHRVPAGFDVFLTRRLFINVVGFEYFADEFQNLDNRISIGAGLGYDIVDNSWLFIDLAATAAYQSTRYISVETGDKEDQDAALVLRTSIDFDLPRGVEWDNLYSVQLTLTDFDKTNMHAESILSLDIWGPLELEVGFVFDRVNEPVADADGITPKSNDYRTTLGLAIDF